MGTKSRMPRAYLHGLKFNQSWQYTVKKALKSIGVQILSEGFSDGSTTYSFIIASNLSLNRLRARLEQFGLDYSEAFDPCQYI